MFPKVLLLTAILVEMVLLLVALLLMTTDVSNSLLALLLVAHIVTCVIYINGLEAVLPEKLRNRPVKEKSGLFLFGFLSPY
ncbi:hypothetical protein [Endozoicomonas sp. SCSIO W0465]|uniref:hypothetical protein n=1 Tax=Endozoicomonas sp. SCSIO W0465 TaxID=2918516 RepID=UPI0020760D67|nr:hypothetical protein [Endozoicomonas sp. SCSIO W0465]USE38957.1 hypothetical protein MJO57_12785 [Endozoicomonas sp. SCSIO W0465]